ncbi:MAG: alpha-amylase family glycosyl hydrolase [Planctomycetota bacterium]
MVESELSDDLAEVEYRSRLTLNRIAPRLDEFWKAQSDYPQRWQRRIEFFQRLDRYWLPLFERLESLYGHRGDFHYHVEQLLLSLASFQLMRNDDLCEVDRQREVEPNWFQSNRIVGGALYVDLFSENLPKLREHVGYFKSLGITYLHLMPLFAVRPGNSDGGYAISNYRSVDPRLGTIDDLRQLANDLHQEGILLVLDFVFNHTSDDHEWAIKAQSGNREYQDFYFLFPDRSQPDRYEQTLREIFPTVRRGNFSWHDGMKKWVWTTFNSFQWDLNYSNPSVFRSMMEEMLFISNLGVDVMRLDAVAFIWKQLGTSCENLPQAHTIIQAFNLGVRIASPGLIFKSEAIVHPDEVVKYISRGECQISYNPTLMALIWESLATRKTDLLRQTLSHRFRLPRATTWVNYLRCHDDIGWTFDDGDASAIGMNASDHRSFLNQFYTGQFPDSFARGIPFQHNLQTGDMRISGTLASLAGLEQALEANDDWKIELAARRIYLMQAISLSIGGIPLIYLGEEWGMLNDYDFISDPAKADDSRWVHRPKMNWAFVESIRNQSSENHASEVPNSAKNVHSEIYCKVKSLIELRKSTSALAGQEMDIFETGNPHLLGFVRRNEGDRLIVLANFSDSTQSIGSNFVRTVGFSRFFKDLIEDKEVNASDKIELSPYQFLWLERA